MDFDRREGFLTLAHEMDVPIVPVVSIGGQETAFFLSRGETFAHALRLDEAFHLKVMPISIALPWGVDVGDLLGHVPLPAKIAIKVLEPIDLREEFGAHPDFDCGVRRSARTHAGGTGRARAAPALSRPGLTLDDPGAGQRWEP